MTNLKLLITNAGALLNSIIPILITIALIVFFWGLIKYIRSGKAAGAKDVMIAGLVGLFVMVSVWGIIRLAQDTLFNGKVQNSPSGIPQVPYITIKPDR